MKHVTTLITDCPMWKKLDLGTVLMMPYSDANKAIKNKWARKTISNHTLRGENVNDESK